MHFPNDKVKRSPTKFIQVQWSESGLMSAQAVSRPQVWCQYPPSEAVEGVVVALEEPRQVVARLQAAASVACPIVVDLRLSGTQCSG